MAVRRPPTRPTAPVVMNAANLQPGLSQIVQGRNVTGLGTTSVASAAIFKPGKKVNPQTDRAQIAKPWQIEAYRQVNICGEARYAAALFANIAGRAEIGISEPQSLVRKPVWIKDGPEVDATT
jgi:hypothetical protein